MSQVDDSVDDLVDDSAAALTRLLAAARTGDLAARAALWRRWHPYVLQRARRAGSGRLRGSDLAQDTAEQALRTLRAFRGQSEPELRAWLDAILRNVIGQRLRAEGRIKRRGVIVPLSQAAPAAAPGPSPSQTLRGKEAWRALLRAVAALPDSQRHVVRRHLRGASVAELAAELDKTPAAISCLLQRGSQAVRVALGEDATGAGDERSVGDWFQAMQALLREAP